MDVKLFDINNFLTRKSYKHADLAKELNCATSLISVWASRSIKSDPQFPSFDKCIKLLELGMTVEEMFGTELMGKVQIFLNEKEKEPENVGEFEKRVCEVLIKHLSGGVK